MMDEPPKDPPMEDEPMMDKPEADGPKPGEYVETRKTCFCLTRKCSVIFTGIFILINIFIEILNVAFMAQNEYFDSIYPTVYGVILLPLAVAAGFFLYYFIAKDSPTTRGLLPWGVILAGVTNLLIFIWVIVYITSLYKYDKVYVNSWDARKEEFDDDTPRYGKMPKATYLFHHCLYPFVNILLYTVEYCVIKDWVDKHANQERAYG